MQRPAAKPRKPIGPLTFKTTPRSTQRTEFFKYRSVAARALLWSMRSGKSKAVIDTFAFNYHVGRITAVVILAPNIAHQNWILEEIPRHMPDQVPWEGMIWNANRARTKQKAYMAQFERVCRGRDKLMILSVNSESLASKVCRAFLKTFLKYHKGKVFLVADESHQYGAPGSARTGATKAIRNASNFRRILSGTAIDESPMQAYSQFEILEEGALGFDTSETFKNHFGIWETKTTKNNRKYQKFLGPKNEEELKTAIAKYASVVTREDAGLLKPIDTQRRFEMTDNQIKVWRALKKEPVMGGRALDGGTLMLKFQQISSGFLVDENKVLHELVKPKDNPRFLLTIHEAMNSDSKFIIWCRFKYDIVKMTEMLEELLVEEGFGRRMLQMYGGVSQKVKFQNLRDLRDDPEVAGIIGQPQSGGAGVDMSVAGTLIWSSHTPSLIQRNQASDRATALGKKAVDLIDIIANNANDDYILNLLGNKEDVSERISRTGLQELLREIGDG